MKNILKTISQVLASALVITFIAACSNITPEGGNTGNGNTGNNGGSGSGSGTTTNPSTPGGDIEYEENNLTSLFQSIIDKQAKTYPREKVYIVAHRANTYKGWQNNIPDNSILAIETAIELGADMVELDVRTTSDGKLVLMHDATVNATTNGTGNIASMTLDQVKALKMKKGSKTWDDQKVPTLEEALAACKDKIFVNLDIKDVTSTNKLVRAIINTGMIDQVMVYSNQSFIREVAEKEFSQNGTLYRIAGHPHIGDPNAVSNFSGLNCKLFQYSYTHYSEYTDGGTFAKQVRSKGFLTYSNILNHDEKIRNGDYTVLDRFINSETDFIQTDFCELIDAYLKNKNLR